MTGKPTVKQIAAITKEGYIKYEIIEYEGVKLLMPFKHQLRNVIQITYSLTQDEAVRALAERKGIILRGVRKIPAPPEIHSKNINIKKTIN